MNKNGKSLLESKMKNGAYKRRHEEQYKLFKQEVQLLNDLEKHHLWWSE